MMKRVMLTTLVGISVVGNLNAINTYQSLQNQVVNFGDVLERIDNVPFIGKLTNLLPAAIVAASFKKCPGQTMALLGGLLAYVVLQNESIRSTLSAYNPIKLKGQKNTSSNTVASDECLFIFDGEDEEDAQEEQDVEDAFLQAELLKKEYRDQAERKLAQQSTINFI